MVMKQALKQYLKTGFNQAIRLIKSAFYLFKLSLKYYKKHLRLSLILSVVLLSLAGYLFFSRSKSPLYDVALVKIGTIRQEVSLNGRLKPAQSVKLAFEKSGTVIYVGAQKSSYVFYGQTLAILDNADLWAQISQAQANIKAEQAHLDQIKKGSRDEEIKLQEIKSANAASTYNEALKQLSHKIKEVYNMADDAVRNKTDQIFSNVQSYNPRLNFYVNDLQLETQLEQQRVLMEDNFKSWKTLVNGLDISNPVDLLGAADKTQAFLSDAADFLNKAGLAVNNASAGLTVSQTTLDSWKSAISLARSNLNSAINGLAASQEKLKSDQYNLALSEQELILKKSGSTPEEITAQEARVEQAQAQLQNLKAQLAKTVLVSPINGLLTQQDAKVGEMITAGISVASVISQNKFEIEAELAEADLSKIKMGDNAKVTLDAWGNDIVFEAKVTAIDPAETMVEGVAIYKVTLQFVNPDARLKSGLTANIDIVGQTKENILVAPQRAIINKNGDRLVKVIDEQGVVNEVPVKTGLRGSDANVEIIAGLKNGDKVVISLAKPK